MQKIRVLYDHQIFTMQKFGGISRYFSILLENLPPVAEVALGVEYSANEHLKKLPLGRAVKPIPQAPPPPKFFGKIARRLGLTPRNGPEASLENSRRCMELLREGNFDIFHPTYYSDYFIPEFGDRPFVLTVYDMIHEVFPELFPLSVPTARTKAILIARADRIIAISESTRQDIIKFYPEAEPKIDVIHLGPTFSKLAAVGESRIQGLPERYFLFTGLRGGYKNFYFFIRVCAPILLEDPSLQVVCTGEGFSSLELEFLANLGISDRVRAVFATEEQLRELYANAVAFIFPSLYEGFGFPILEAFEAGCPAVLSRSSSLTEVGGEAALYFDPKDADQLSRAIHQVLADPDLRRSLVARGREQLKRFSWDITVAKTADTYRKVLAQTRSHG